MALPGSLRCYVQPPLFGFVIPLRFDIWASWFEPFNFLRFFVCANLLLPFICILASHRVI